MTLRLGLALAITSIATALPLALAHPAAAAAGDRVLILGSTVSGGMSSIEATEAQAQGLVVDIVSDATWATMTPSQFSGYRAIILGDPTCSGDPSTVGAAASNASTWEPLLNGNVVIVGTDPVFHAAYGNNSAGARKLSVDAVDFAAAKPGKTGAYISLSCYYSGAGPGTAIPLLDGLQQGGFTATGVDCQDSGHIVAVSPAINSLTDSDLQNWQCSVHEGFDKFPGNFTVLAIDQSHASTFTASDGTTGIPYILASGDVKSFPLSLAPLSDTGTAGGTHTVTAQLLDSATGQPVGGKHIGFGIVKGPNLGASGNCNTPFCDTQDSGQVSWTYKSNGISGDDSIQAYVDLNFNGHDDLGEPQTTAGMRWMQAPRQMVFVHGINGNFADVVAHTSYQNLVVPVEGAGIPVTVFAYYQDFGYRQFDPSTNAYQCQTPAPDTDTAPLYTDPNSINPTICDSKSALAYNSAALDQVLNRQTGPVTVTANSLGGAITRGWLTYAQNGGGHHGGPDPALTSIVDSVIFLQGGQQGSYVAGAGEALDTTVSIFAPIDEYILRRIAKQANFDPHRPGVRDVAPISAWYDSVNPSGVPANLHYYNFIADLQPTLTINLGFRQITKGPAHLGDLIFRLGTNDPTQEPLAGGARFLPGGQQTSDRHQYEIARPHSFGLFDVIRPDKSNAALQLQGDPASHFNFGENMNAPSKYTIASCSQGDQVTPTQEILRLLSNPAQGCH